MEIWNLYTEDRQLTSQIHYRGAPIPDDRYHLVVHVWLKNGEGKYLLTQRSGNRKRFPFMWECTCGSVLAGETSIEGALREVKEEVGIILDLQDNSGRLVRSCIRKFFQGKKYNDILDIWVIETEEEPDLAHASTDEVADTKWMDASEVRSLWQTGKMNPELEYFFTTSSSDF